MKLPAFYLLDAISKNVYEPYARVFASIVIPLFLDTYRTVDEGTRSKMDEMFLTWRTGAPNGKELFGLGPQMAIERGIWGNQAGPGQITKTQVMSELNFALQAKERALLTNPNDHASKHHIQVLYQLRSLVEAGVSQEELTQILTQLRGLVRSSTTQPPVPQQPQWSVPQFAPPAPNTYPPTSGGFPTTSSTFPVTKTEPSTSLLPPASVPTSSAPVDTTQLNITNILSSLMKSGLVSTAQGDPTASKTESVEPEEAKSVGPSMEDLNAIREARANYRKRILSEKMEANLVENSIDDPHVPVPDLLYDYLSLQCQQCGIRYPDTTLGKKQLEDHLDLHFKQNRKLNQSLGRGHDRSWFTNVEDWVQELSNVKNQQSFRIDTHEKDTGPTEKMQSQTSLKSQYVTVPPGDEAKPLSCPICKETLSIEFLEDEEEWVWKNAVKKDDRVYHATCRAEAAAANSLVTRLKTETGLGSRGSTPEVVSSRTTPPLVRAPRSPSRST
jgi:pre-mRNA cleavage complex 2 protein Pcf11